MEPPKRPRITVSSAKRGLEELIQTCEAIKERKFNPFFLDVAAGVETLRRYFPLWETFEDHCLDARALNSLSEVVRLQNSQIKFLSSRVYTDPESLVRKIEALSVKRLGETFLKSWHPVLELEQLTESALEEGMMYWNELLPFRERLRRLEPIKPIAAEALDVEELLRLGIISKEEFGRAVAGLWEELKERSGGAGKLEYLEFVRSPDFGQTVRRAYLLSFLVTFGFARLVERERGIFVASNDSQIPPRQEALVSFPIALGRKAR